MKRQTGLDRDMKNLGICVYGNRWVFMKTVRVE